MFVCCAISQYSFADPHCDLCSGAEDNVHALGFDDHFCNTSQSVVLRLHVVDSSISNSNEIDIVVSVALINEVALDGLVNVLGRFTLNDVEFLSGDVHLCTDRVAVALDLTHLDVHFLAGDDNEVVVLSHHS